MSESAPSNPEISPAPLSAGDVTLLLGAMREGDAAAGDRVLELVYRDLRDRAAGYFRNVRSDHTLQPTALVHEAYLRLVDPGKAHHWNSRGHFFAAAAEAMRRILVESARRTAAQKRGGDRSRLPLDDAEIPLVRPADELLAIHDALDQLATIDARAAELVKLRYFVGLTGDEAAQALGISPRTVDGVWAYARAWLRVQLDPSSSSTTTHPASQVPW